MNRLAKQLQFILEIDKLKSVYRRTYLIDGTRHERVLDRNIAISQGSVTLWEWTQTLIGQATAEGNFPKAE